MYANYVNKQLALLGIYNFKEKYIDKKKSNIINLKKIVVPENMHYKQPFDIQSKSQTKLNSFQMLWQNIKPYANMSNIQFKQYQCVTNVIFWQKSKCK